MPRRSLIIAQKRVVAICLMIASIIFGLLPTWALDSLEIQNHELEFSWDLNGFLFTSEMGKNPDLTLFENNHYKFFKQVDDNITFTLGESVGVESISSDFFNNTFLKVDEYLLFSPSYGEPNVIFYFNPSDPSNYGRLLINPYEKTDLLFCETPNQEANFGVSLVIDEQNQTIVGASKENGDEGKIFVFRRNADFSLNQIQEIASPESLGRMSFGSSMAVRDSVLVVGAPDTDNFRGKVYLFNREADGNYSNTPFQTLEDPFAQDNDTFGSDIALTGDFLAISSLQKGFGSGKVALFAKDMVSGNWNHHLSLWSDENGSVEQFGYSLDMSSQYLLVGSPREDEIGHPLLSGMAYLFEKDLSGNWDTTPTKFAPSGLSASDEFGSSVALNGDFAFVGAKRGGGNDAGIVYVFQKQGNDWIEIQQIESPLDESLIHFSESLNSLDDLLGVSSPGAGEDGQVYLYRLSAEDNNWSLISALDLNDSSISERTLAPFSIASGMIVVGNPEDSAAQPFAGSMQAFYNSAWQDYAKMMLPPILESNQTTQFVGAEDAYNLNYDFNGSHPFDSNLTWSISHYDSSDESFEFNATSGDFQFSPDSNFSGNLTFTIKLEGTHGFDEHNFSIEITAEPDPPVFSNPGDWSLPYAMVGDDYDFFIQTTDADGDDLNLTVSNLPAGLVFDWETDTITGNPDSSAVSSEDGAFKEYTVVIAIDDSVFPVVTRNFSLRVYERNNQPRFENSEGNVSSPLQLTLQEDFSEEDWFASHPMMTLVDDDGDDLSLEILSDSAIGAIISVNENASDGKYITYEPVEHFHGEDNFTIRLQDSNQFPEPKFVDLKFELEITSVNDMPDITSFPLNLSTAEGEVFNYQVVVEEVDEGDSFSVEATGLPEWLTFNSDTLVLSGTPKWYDYSPVGDTIFISAEDSFGAKDTQAFPLMVVPDNYPPVISQGDLLEFEISEDNQPVAWETLVLSYTDQDTDSTRLSWVVINQPSNGQVSITPSGNDVLVDYLPDGNYSGTDSFELSITDLDDENATDLIRVEVTIQPVEDSPVFTTKPVYIDAVIDYSWEYLIGFIDGDPGDSVSISYDGDIDWINELGDVNATNAKIFGTPTSADLGVTNSITLQISDELWNSNEQIFTVNVISENFAPIIEQGASSSVVLDEDSLWDLDFEITVLEENMQPLNWSVSENPTSGVIEFDSAMERIEHLRYTPNDNFFGFDFVVLQVSDGIDSADFRIDFEVINTPDPPFFVDSFGDDSIEDGLPYEKVLEFNDTDGLTGIQYEFTNLPSWLHVEDETLEQGKIILSGTPSVFDEATNEISLTITDLDGHSVSSSYSLTVFVLNFSPLFSNDSDEIAYEINMTEDLAETWISPTLDVSDVETPFADLIWSVVDAPENGELSLGNTPSTSIVYLPDANFSGQDFFQVGVTDIDENGDSRPKTSVATFTVNVLPVNDAPVFKSTPTTNSQERVSWNDESEYEYELIAFDHDLPEGNELIIRMTSELPDWLDFNQTGNGSAKLSGLAKVADEGDYQLNFEVLDTEDSSLIAHHSFRLYIIIDDYPPVYLSNVNQSSTNRVRFFIEEDSEVSTWIGSAGFGAINPDPESDDLDSISWSSEEASNFGSVIEVSGSGFIPQTFLYEPPEDFNGQDSFSIRMSEGDRFSILEIEAYVSSVPDFPVFTSDLPEQITLEAGEYFEIEVNATDADSESLQFRLFASAWDTQPWLSITGNEAGGITIGGTPRIGSFGNQYPYSVFVLDETGRFAKIGTTFTVVGENLPPTITSGTNLTIVFDSNGSPVNLDLDDLYAIDPDSSELDWSLVDSKKPKFGFAEVSGQGSFPSILTYLPNDVDVEEDFFSIRVSDGKSNDEIQIKAVVLWDSEQPVLSLSDEDSILEVLEGTSFSLEADIVHQDLRERFEWSLIKGPSWVRLENDGNRTFILSGVTPIGEYGDFEVEVEITGIRSTPESLEKTIRVLDGTPPRLKLLGSKYQRLAKDETFEEPGFVAEDQNGEDISDRVQVDEVQGGLQKLNYSVADDAGNQAKSFRILNKYIESPLNLDRVILVESNRQANLSWGKSENFYLLADGVQSITEDDLEYSLVLSPEDSSLIRFHKTEATTKIDMQISGESVMLYDLIETSDSRYMLGAFEKELKVIDKQVFSNSLISCFLLKTNIEGEFEWLQTLGIDGSLANPELLLHSNEISILGSLWGRVEFNGESIAEAFIGSRPCVLSFSQYGSFSKSDILSSDSNEILIGCANGEDDSLFLVSQNDAENESLGKLVKLNSNFEILNELEIKASEALSLLDFRADGDGLWVVGDFQGDLQVGETNSMNSQVPSGFVLKVSKDLKVEFIVEFISSVHSSLVSFNFDAIGDPLCLLEFTGDVSIDDDSISSLGSQDLLLIKVRSSDGKTLWTKQIGGEGNEQLVNFAINEVGTPIISLTSDQEFVVDETHIPQTANDESLLLTFMPNSGNPSASFDSLNLVAEQTFSYRLNVPHPDFLFFSLIDAPSWLNLLTDDDSNGSCLLMGVPPIETFPTQDQGSFTVKIYNAEGGFSDLEIDYNIEYEADHLVQFGYLPESSDNAIVKFGDTGEILSILPGIKEDHLILVGTFENTLTWKDWQIDATGNTDGFVLYLDDSRSVSNHFTFNSSSLLNLSSACLDEVGNLFVYGNFKGKITIADRQLRSQGANDLFLLKLSSFGQVDNMIRFGGSFDEFATSLVMDDAGGIYLGGSYDEKTSIGNEILDSNGDEDAFLFKVTEDDLEEVEWIKSFGGFGVDRVLDLHFVKEEGRLIMGGSFHDSIDVGNKRFESVGGNGVLLMLFDTTGKSLATNAITESGDLSSLHLGWHIIDQTFLMSGDFLGSFSFDQSRVFSKGGRDIFVAKINSDLSCRNLFSFGGRWNERINDMLVTEKGNALLAGTFYEEIELGSEKYVTAGLNDGFVVKLNEAGDEIYDSFQLGTSGEDRIDVLYSSDPRYIVYSGVSSYDESSHRELFIKEVGQNPAYPQTVLPLPSTAYAGLPFEFEIVTFGWSSERGEFLISEINGTENYTWLETEIDQFGKLKIAGVAPKEPGNYPLSIELGDSHGEVLSIHFILEFIEIDSVPPTILSESQYNLNQFTDFYETLELFDRDGDDLLIEVQHPTWVSWMWEDERFFSFEGRAEQGSLGDHLLTIKATDTKGLSVEKIITLKVSPTFKSNGNENESNNWFGEFFVMQSGWLYHLDFGWIYLSPNETGEDLWFWKKGWGWTWTSVELWSAVDKRGFIYLNKDKGWLYFESPSSYFQSRVYSYKQSKWYSYPLGMLE